MKTDHLHPFNTGPYRPLTTFTTFTTPLTQADGSVEHFNERKRPFHFHCAAVDRSYITPVHQFDSGMSDKQTLRIENQMDRWRFVCPRGHRSWEPTNHHFWCAQCARMKEFDGVFYELVDRKTGREYERDEVQLLTAAGPYDRDLDRRGTV